jgi:hypothetical protein
MFSYRKALYQLVFYIGRYKPSVIVDHFKDIIAFHNLPLRDYLVKVHVLSGLFTGQIIHIFKGHKVFKAIYNRGYYSSSAYSYRGHVFFKLSHKHLIFDSYIRTDICIYILGYYYLVTVIYILRDAVP